MNIHEASARLYVPGMPNPGKVNRYYVLSEILRERGWKGVGDYWYQPNHSSPVSFEYALSVTGLGRWYDWRATKEILERNTAELRRSLRKGFEEMILVAERAAAAFRKVYEAAGYPAGGSGGK